MDAYADGVAPARPARQRRPRRMDAVGEGKATPTATLGVARFSYFSEIIKIITNSYDVRKMHIRYQNFQKNMLYPFMSKSCISE